MKNKGITLISLIITVVILGIIGTVTIYSGTKAITSARLKRFSAEMEIIRLKCNELLEEGITIEDLLILGQEIEILSEDKLSKINNALQQVTSSADTQGYVYFDKHGLRNLGIVSIDREVIINFDEKVIIDINGVKNENDEYIYTINWTSNAVLATNVPLQSIALDNTSYTLTIGKTFTLTPIITPTNASNRKVTWTSSDDSIATVAPNGVVKAIQEGTVTITATTEDGGKNASCTVRIGPNYFDKTKVPNIVVETSTIAGVNKERIAPIPAGYVASSVRGEDTISGGLVIYQGDEDVTSTNHSTAMLNRNQYVWIPVDDINDMVMCKQNGNAGVGGATTCKLEYNITTGHITCKTHGYTTAIALTDETIDTTGLAGRLYAGASTTIDKETPKIYTTNMPFTQASKDAQQFSTSTTYREPDIVTNCDDSNYNLITNASTTQAVTSVNELKHQLNNKFIEMTLSIAKYGGFYVSRFEPSYENNKVISKKDKAVLTAAISTSGNYIAGDKWYGLYNKTLNNTEKGSSVKSHMIWGCQYDQIIKILGTEKGTTGHLYQTNKQEKTGYDYETNGTKYVDEDILYNIYDLEGNNNEWTVQAYNTSGRVLRGNDYTRANGGEYYPASYCLVGSPTYTGNSDITTRPTLVVEL